MRIISSYRLYGKRDLIIISAIILAGLLSALVYCIIFNNNSSENDVCAEILYDGEIVKTVSLNKDGRFSVDGAPNVILEIKDRKISFVQSDCPDKICVRSGKLYASGHFAACLPNKVSVRIAGGGESAADAVAR